MGSFDDIFLVQLFSKPQQIHAEIMKSEPEEKRKLVISSTDRIEQDMSTSAMPPQSLGLILSLNIAGI